MRWSLKEAADEMSRPSGQCSPLPVDSLFFKFLDKVLDAWPPAHGPELVKEVMQLLPYHPLMHDKVEVLRANVNISAETMEQLQTLHAWQRSTLNGVLPMFAKVVEHSFSLKIVGAVVRVQRLLPAARALRRFAAGRMHVSYVCEWACVFQCNGCFTITSPCTTIQEVARECLHQAGLAHPTDVSTSLQWGDPITEMFFRHAAALCIIAHSIERLIFENHRRVEVLVEQYASGSDMHDDEDAVVQDKAALARKRAAAAAKRTPEECVAAGRRIIAVFVRSAPFYEPVRFARSLDGLYPPARSEAELAAVAADRSSRTSLLAMRMDLEGVSVATRPQRVLELWRTATDALVAHAVTAATARIAASSPAGSNAIAAAAASAVSLAETLRLTLRQGLEIDTHQADAHRTMLHTAVALGDIESTRFRKCYRVSCA